jgi:Beta-galactosidase/beta-glucuronidase
LGYLCNYTYSNKDNAEIKIETNIKNSSDLSQTFELYSILIDKEGKEIAGINNSESVGVGENISMNQSLKVSNPILWSIDNPYLYKIVTRIEQNGKVVDEYETPLGIRYFSFDPNKGFFLMANL